MAEAVISHLLDVIFGNLSSAAMEQLHLGSGVDKELKNLESTLSAIQAVLEDAEEMESVPKSVQDWLHKLKEVAYDADDLVDEIATEAQWQLKTDESKTTEAAGKKRKRVWDYISSFLNSGQRDMAIRIREINIRLDKITKERNDLHLKIGDGRRRRQRLETRERPQVSSVMSVSESKVFGQENDIEDIITALLSDDDYGNKGNFSVIAIVGMGGLGKTTIAQVVYNEERVTKHFEPRAWVCVSVDFDIKRLTKEILASADESCGDLSDIDSLQCRLREQLREKKFLIVLDDVWSENSSFWEALRAPFTFGAKGSKILVTTRNESVSAVFRPAFTHHLKDLSRDDCWKLLLHRAFMDDNINEYPELLEMGNNIVDKCHGLPLAAKALGGLLSSKREKRQWEYVLESAIWDLPGEAEDILPALRLSYYHLPTHLKRCFTFCAVFPKDYQFSKEKLVPLWIGNGFVRPKDGKRIEDTGFGYFSDLLQRSFFQDSGFGYFTMHDLFHDLAKSISGSECFHMASGKRDGDLRKTRHLSYFDFRESIDFEAFHESKGTDVVVREPINFEAFYESKGLRTFLLIKSKARRSITPGNVTVINVKVLHEMFGRLGFIRVLDLSRACIKVLPDSIGNLRHLRCLNLQSNYIEELPESLCRIYSLQTLNLAHCLSLVKLPNETRKLINLRHLDLQYGGRFVSMPPQIGRLTSLQTLPIFVVGEERERGIAQLERLTDIRGELHIKKLENVGEAEEAREANLKNKQFIDLLELQWNANNDYSPQDERVQGEILDGLRPHPNLKTLFIHGYMGARFPSWMILLHNLMKVELIDCKRCSILPPLGHLPLLSYFCISGMDEVKQIRAGRFPSLAELHLKSMLNLEHWNGAEEGCFPLLWMLTISDCPKLRQMPCGAFPSLKNLDIRSCAGFISLPQLSSLEKLTLKDLASLEKWCGLGDVGLKHGPFPNLKKLCIDRCGRLISLPQLPSLKELGLLDLANLGEWCGTGEAGFPHLRKLRIVGCPELREWPKILSALTELSVSYCQGFREWPKMLPALTELSVSYCEGFDALPPIPSLCKLVLKGSNERLLSSVPCLSWLSHLAISELSKLTSLHRWTLQALSQLRKLRISRCNELVRLTEEKGLQDGSSLPSTLTHLSFSKCSNLKALPRGLHALTSLQSLEIFACPQLTSLPELGLPRALQSFYLGGCPALKERCLRDRGEDWPKISHIPRVDLNFRSL